MATQAEIQRGIEAALDLFKNKDRIKKEIDALIIVREDIKMKIGKEQKKANIEMEEFKSQRNQEINKLLDQKLSLEGALNRLKNEIRAKKDSIVNFDITLGELGIEINDVKQRLNKLKEEKEGLDAHLRQVSSKYNG